MLLLNRSQLASKIGKNRFPSLPLLVKVSCIDVLVALAQRNLTFQGIQRLKGYLLETNITCFNCQERYRTQAAKSSGIFRDFRGAFVFTWRVRWPSQIRRQLRHRVESTSGWPPLPDSR